jgi:hypothetical protein
MPTVSPGCVTDPVSSNDHLHSPHGDQRDRQRLCSSELGQFDDAWRYIGEAMTAVEKTKGGGRPRSIAQEGEITLPSPEPDAAKSDLNGRTAAVDFAKGSTTYCAGALPPMRTETSPVRWPKNASIGN